MNEKWQKYAQEKAEAAADEYAHRSPGHRDDLVRVIARAIDQAVTDAMCAEADEQRSEPA